MSQKIDPRPGGTRTVCLKHGIPAIQTGGLGTLEALP
jgi:hypothetical protein